MYVSTYHLHKICKKLAEHGDREQLTNELANYCKVDTATFLCREDSDELINRGMNLINRGKK
jgi:hypothetical protein